MTNLLDESQALQVLLCLSPGAALRALQTSKSGALSAAAASAALWSDHAARTFDFLAEKSTPSCPPPDGGDDGRQPAPAVWSAALFGRWARVAAEAGATLDDGAPLEAAEPGALRLSTRWVSSWARMRRWLAAHAPSLARSLRGPARPWDLQNIPKALSLNLEGQGSGGLDPTTSPTGALKPTSLVMGLWQLVDGQNSAVADRSLADELELGSGSQSEGEQPLFARGLLGGYSAYDHDVTTQLLPLRAALKLTNVLQKHLAGLVSQHPTKMAFACSHNLAKVFFVDMADGDVYVWTRRPSPLLERVAPSAKNLVEGAAVRVSGLKAKPELNGAQGLLVAFNGNRWQVRIEGDSKDVLLKEENLDSAPDASGQPSPAEPLSGLIRWFEEFVRRLEAGVYAWRALRLERSPAPEAICLFPTAGPEHSRCVTRGVEVVASCVYSPEHTAGWCYSISFRLLGSADDRGFETCQLTSRQWEIAEDGRPPQSVEGVGVVGFFPILVDGGWVLNEESDPAGQFDRPHGVVEGAFVYQSCSGRTESMRGTFAGQLTFMPGTRLRPAGPPFQARLEPIRLHVPAFVY